MIRSARRARLVVFYLVFGVFCGCHTLDVVSVPFHQPLVPEAGKAVRYEVDFRGSHPIRRVSLSVRTGSLVKPFNFGAPNSLKNWTFPHGVNHAHVTFVDQAGYSSGTMVEYTFEFEDIHGSIEQRAVAFAVGFGAASQPIPAYVQGAVEDQINLVFIPNPDIADAAAFREHCGLMIRDAFLKEPLLRVLGGHFNFFVNRQTGHL